VVRQRTSQGIFVHGIVIYEQYFHICFLEPVFILVW